MQRLEGEWQELKIENSEVLSELLPGQRGELEYLDEQEPATPEAEPGVPKELRERETL